ncbi:hypothetical protein CALCODRAFT_511561 [Calocera cornea HHB12733]|uniref:Uncharacterized protein n=1 Tax=Calocera cornea HHB12733 TaxID=1353952 RepID=A0A165DNR2_9BASI|nr:hypothetical protein CALCODRAFT_511561 [Calocera cornea HHB12733]
MSTPTPDELDEHFLRPLGRRWSGTILNDIPPHLLRVLNHYEAEYDMWWKRCREDEKSRAKLGKLMVSPLPGKNPTGSQVFAGMRHLQAAKSTVDMVKFAYDSLPLPGTGCCAMFGIPANHYDHPDAPARARDRAKQFVRHTNNYWSAFEKFYKTLEEHGDAEDVSSTSELDFVTIVNIAMRTYARAGDQNILANFILFASILCGLEHLQVNRSGIPKFHQVLESGMKRKRCQSTGNAIVLPEPPSQLMRPFELSGFLSPSILFMPQQLVGSDLSLHLAAQAHVVHSDYWPPPSQDPEVYVALRVDQLVIRSCVDIAFGNTPRTVAAIRKALLSGLAPALQLESLLWADRTRIPTRHANIRTDTPDGNDNSDDEQVLHSPEDDVDSALGSEDELPSSNLSLSTVPHGQERGEGHPRLSEALRGAVDHGPGSPNGDDTMVDSTPSSATEDTKDVLSNNDSGPSSQSSLISTDTPLDVDSIFNSSQPSIIRDLLETPALSPNDFWAPPTSPDLDAQIISLTVVAPIDIVVTEELLSGDNDLPPIASSTPPAILATYGDNVDLSSNVHLKPVAMGRSTPSSDANEGEECTALQSDTTLAVKVRRSDRLQFSALSVPGAFREVGGGSLHTNSRNTNKTAPLDHTPNKDSGDNDGGHHVEDTARGQCVPPLQSGHTQGEPEEQDLGTAPEASLEEVKESKANTILPEKYGHPGKPKELPPDVMDQLNALGDSLPMEHDAGWAGVWACRDYLAPLPEDLSSLSDDEELDIPHDGPSRELVHLLPTNTSLEDPIVNHVYSFKTNQARRIKLAFPARQYSPPNDAMHRRLNTLAEHATLLEPHLKLLNNHPEFRTRWPLKAYRPDNGPVWFFMREHLQQTKTWQLLDWAKDHCLVIVDGVTLETELVWDSGEQDENPTTVWMPLRYVVNATARYQQFPIVHVPRIVQTAPSSSVTLAALSALDSASVVWNATSCIPGIVRDPPSWRWQGLSTCGASSPALFESGGLAFSMAITGGVSLQSTRETLALEDGGQLVWFMGKEIKTYLTPDHDPNVDLDFYAKKERPPRMKQGDSHSQLLGQHLAWSANNMLAVVQMVIDEDLLHPAQAFDPSSAYHGQLQRVYVDPAAQAQQHMARSACREIISTVFSSHEAYQKYVLLNMPKTCHLRARLLAHYATRAKSDWCP